LPLSHVHAIERHTAEIENDVLGYAARYGLLDLLSPEHERRASFRLIDGGDEASDDDSDGG
jgi:hypothetical protein